MSEYESLSPSPRQSHTTQKRRALSCGEGLSLVVAKVASLLRTKNFGPSFATVKWDSPWRTRGLAEKLFPFAAAKLGSEGGTLYFYPLSLRFSNVLKIRTCRMPKTKIFP